MEKICRLYDLGALVCWIIVTVLVLLEVITRNILFVSTPWAEEASRFFTVWTVFLGAAAAWFRGTHITIDVIPRRLSGRVKLIWQVAVEVLNTIFMVALMIGTVKLTVISYAAKTTAMEISISYLYLAVAVGGMGMIIFQIQRFRNLANEMAGSGQGA